MILDVIEIFAPIVVFFCGIGGLVYGGPIINRIKYRLRSTTVGHRGVADADVMEPIIASLNEFTADWLITSALTRFPRAGNAAQISLSFENNWYHVSVQGDTGNQERPVSSYYNEKLKHLIRELATKRISKDVNALLYPNGRDQLLLTTSKGS